jgi:hypothetical protein
VLKLLVNSLPANSGANAPNEAKDQAC